MTNCRSDDRDSMTVLFYSLIGLKESLAKKKKGSYATASWADPFA
jgi:hypothetical protein